MEYVQIVHNERIVSRNQDGQARDQLLIAENQSDMIDSALPAAEAIATISGKQLPVRMSQELWRKKTTPVC